MAASCTRAALMCGYQQVLSGTACSGELDYRVVTSGLLLRPLKTPADLFVPQFYKVLLFFFLHLPEKTSVSKFFTEWLYLTRLVTSLLSLRKYISLKKHLINRKCLLCYEVIFITRCKPSSHLFTLNNFSVFLFNFQIILLISTLFLSWKRGQILSHVSK